MSPGVRKARKKPVEIEFMVWPGEAKNATSVIQWVLDNDGTARYVGPIPHKSECPGEGGPFRYCSEPGCDFADPGGEWLNIDTLEGVMRAKAGDVIIKGVQGEFYPCKPAIFQETYEVISDDE